MPKKKFSQSPWHQGHYRVLVHDAWLAHCQRTGEAPNCKSAAETFRRKINVDTTGKYSTKEMNCSKDFDAVMMELAIIAGNDYWLNKLSLSESRRYRHVIQWFIYDLEYLEQKPISWKYVQSIAKQANFTGTSLKDCPVEHLAEIMKMIDTHVRRLAKKAGITRADLPTAYMRKGKTDVEAKALWHHDHKHHITHGEAVHA
jgi:hypothetical protein